MPVALTHREAKRKKKCIPLHTGDRGNVCGLGIAGTPCDDIQEPDSEGDETEPDAQVLLHLWRAPDIVGKENHEES